MRACVRRVIARRAYKCLQLSCCKPTSLTDGASRLVFVSEAKVSLFGSVLRRKLVFLSCRFASLQRSAREE